MLDPAVELLRRGVEALGLPLRSVEVELGPSQVEFTFRPQAGLAAADTMVLFRAAVKQIARRNGYLASFMCRPALPNVMSSGWHLHQSLIDRKTSRNAFVVPRTGCRRSAGISSPACSRMRARAAAFTTPTVNGYKRYRPYSLAPDRAIWARDNRGVMIRVLGQPGDPSTHLENRVGEPAANPYLYMASQIHAGLDGDRAQARSGPLRRHALRDIGAAAAGNDLGEAIAALRADDCFRAGFGAAFIDYYAHIKEAELERFRKEQADSAEVDALGAERISGPVLI